MYLYPFKLSSQEELLSKEIYTKAFVFDSLGNYPTLDNFKSIEEMINGGINGINISLAFSLHNFNKALDQVLKYKRIIKDNPERLILVESFKDFDITKKDNKLAIVFLFQDSVPIGNNLKYLDVFHKLGVKVIQLTYNDQNFVGTGCCELFCNKLTNFGRDVVQRMNELGMVIDLSHCSEDTTLDAINISKDPVLISHASVYNLCKAKHRNKSDRVLKALALKGGVIGICFFPPLVKRNEETYEVLPSTIEDVLDHIDYTVNLIGINHVAFGSDLTEYGLGENSEGLKKIPSHSSIIGYRKRRPDVFGKGSLEYYEPYPIGLQSHSTFINLSRGLLKRGYKEGEIKKILGENILNLYKKVWKN